MSIWFLTSRGKSILLLIFDDSSRSTDPNVQSAKLNLTVIRLQNLMLKNFAHVETLPICVSS